MALDSIVRNAPRKPIQRLFQIQRANGTSSPKIPRGSLCCRSYGHENVSGISWLSKTSLDGFSDALSSQTNG
jgi:hypothetical protein